MRFDEPLLDDNCDKYPWQLIGHLLCQTSRLFRRCCCLLFVLFLPSCFLSDSRWRPHSWFLPLDAPTCTVLGLPYAMYWRNPGRTTRSVLTTCPVADSAAIVMSVPSGLNVTGTASRHSWPAWQPARRGPGVPGRLLMTRAVRPRTVPLGKVGSSLTRHQHWRLRLRLPSQVSHPGSLQRHGVEPASV